MPITIQSWNKAVPQHLGDEILILDGLVRLSDEESTHLIESVVELRRRGLLSELRGGRKTELARPISKEIGEVVLSEFPAITKAVQVVEEALKGSPLFLRTLKFDEARASSTEVSNDWTKSNFHFDYPKSSIRDYPGTNPQFYLNLGQKPRNFRVVMLPLPDMARMVARDGERYDLITAQEVASRYALTASVENVSIEHGAMAVFDGRRFMHDAGKGRWNPNGSFIPSRESDMVAALDLTSAEHYGMYDPVLPFLEDVRI